MERKRNSIFSYIGVAVFVAFMSMMLMGAEKTIPIGKTKASTLATNTYADSQVDTVYWTRDKQCVSASFWAYFGDSSSVTSVAVWRYFNGVRMASITADTLATFATYSAIGAAQAANVVGEQFVYSALGQPMAEKYAFVMTYAGSNNGVTSNDVTYGITKRYDN